MAGDKSYSNKFALIYEFNNSSPLFVRVADAAVCKGKYEKAISVLEKGITELPKYPTPYLVLAKAYALIGEYDKAREQVQVAYSLLNSEKTRKYYLDLIENIEDGKYDELTNSVGSTKSINVDNELEDLANKINSASIPKVDDNAIENYEMEINLNDDEIVSETLASIYYAQGNLKEALEMYEKLININPPKRDFFIQRIASIKEQLSSK